MDDQNLQNLTLDELKKLKKSWWSEAENDGLFSKLSQVIKSFGRVTCISTSIVSCSYKKDDLKISHTQNFGIGYTKIYCKVYYKEKLVYDYYDKLFVPGEWTSLINSIYLESQELKRQELIKQLSSN